MLAYSVCMAVREGLLALLHEGPRHGYQLKTEFEAATGGVWPLNVGQVYTTLDRLERDGLVDVHVQNTDEGAAQKLYGITIDGVAALGQWWDAVPSDDPPPRDELMLKVLMAIDHSREHALRVVTHQRTVLLALLQAKRRERKTAGDDTPQVTSIAARLVTDALVTRAEADLRWLEMCEAQLQRQPVRGRKDGGS